MTLTLRYAAHSDRGLIRDGNQDSVYAGPRLLAVADGMGGMAAGDVASNIVIGAMAPLDEDVPGDALVDALRSAVGTANQQLRDTVDANPQLEGMGTTLTATLFSGSKLGMVHIGDSRAYLLRNGEFAQITKDDTYVQMLVDEGRISAEEASSHPQRSLLTRALDGRDIDPEYSVRQVLPGDRYLICSDGLSGVVSADTIGDTMREYPDPQQCVERLVQLALRGGGPDNITVIIADATDQDIVEASPIVGGAAARDRGMATSADVSTPAARASALSAPRSPAPEEPADNRDDEPERRRHRPLRSAAMLLALLVILGGGLFAGWSYTQRQYYVGATEQGQLAVFRGVPGQIAGLDLSSVHSTSGAKLDDLTLAAQEQVKQGIQAKSEPDAQRRLAELTSDDPANPNLKPMCPPSPTAAAVSPTAAAVSPTPAVTASAVAPPVSASARPPVTPTPAPTTTPDAVPSDTVPPVDPAGCRSPE
ncbi:MULTISPECIES: PP2C family serine/threonine-protein phosphatase [Micromonospora]|uniref:Serine/threonine protein phosphatase PstP n=1 Tax=Micromonospora sicca TaxID=2202420 RepID=A0A317DJK4_9ACTN|nr:MULTISPECIES: PP2C family serine/threonine-protein phosphatase [unclassified Micromonospora]MBM0227751.1 serine/threonine-protein phosphatase [Micromonospora sp. ATA51]MDZ5444252.1 PP2C family serine/threonine-protein phosphatase [Micromonospora sp. 4G57]MDZ5489394.1 PP2C family serine/threonine-protein phosphatase [Micromonospora sp. 4G53]PWR14828.1 protein phosphatase [Micromonospora sp. 4G51]